MLLGYVSISGLGKLLGTPFLTGPQFHPQTLKAVSLQGNELDTVLLSTKIYCVLEAATRGTFHSWPSSIGPRRSYESKNTAAATALCCSKPRICIRIPSSSSLWMQYWLQHDSYLGNGPNMWLKCGSCLKDTPLPRCLGSHPYRNCHEYINYLNH